MHNAPIVVGVDASSSALSAARYAVREATIRHCDVRLVHGYGSRLAAAPYSALQLNRIHTAAESFLDAFATHVDVPGHVDLDARAYNATAVRALVEAASDALFVVVGHDAGSWHVGGSSVAAWLFDRADLPVVAVPVDPVPVTSTSAAVVVVVDGRASAGPALDFAFQRADLSGNTVIVLDTAPAADGVAESRDSAAIAARRARHPEVGCVVEFVHDGTENAIAASRNASLLVIGRSASSGDGTGRSRSVRHAVLSRAGCPVAVVPTRATRPAMPRTRPWRLPGPALPRQ